MQTIADKAGVSNVLRQRIIKIAKDLGHHPNPLITTLMANLRAQRERPSSETGTVLAFGC